MKEIINGKLYNTKTALLRGKCQGNRVYFCYDQELYMKITGEYFLVEYEIDEFTDKVCSKEIIPITTKKAKAWVEEHLSTEEYIAFFGEPEE